MSHDFFFIRADYEGSKKTKEINLHNRKQSWNRFPFQRNKGALGSEVSFSVREVYGRLMDTFNHICFPCLQTSLMGLFTPKISEEGKKK